MATFLSRQRFPWVGSTRKLTHNPLPSPGGKRRKDFAGARCLLLDGGPGGWEEEEEEERGAAVIALFCFPESLPSHRTGTMGKARQLHAPACR